MNKKILSIVLIFAMIFSLIPQLSNNFDSYADTSKEIRVRVEGKDGKLYDTEVEVTDEMTGLDLLKTAIGEENIVGHEDSYGYFIDGIKKDGNVEEGEEGEGYKTSWGIYIEKDGNLESAPVGISSLPLEGVDELLLHIKATTPSWSDLTYIPKVEIKQEGINTELTVKKTVVTYDAEWNSSTSEEKVEQAVLDIEGIKHTTDSEGKVTVQLTPGVHNINVSKEGENYPELIRRSYEYELVNPSAGKEIRVRVEGKDGKLYDTEVEVTDEMTGLDLLKTAIGEENIVGHEDSYGYFIDGIKKDGNVEEGEEGEGYKTSWGIYIEKDGNLESAPVGISSLPLEGVDELLLHIKATTPSWSDLTYIPKVEIKQEGINTELTVKKTVVTYDAEWNSSTSEEKVEQAVLDIEGIKHTTDSEGKVTVQLTPGVHNINVSKEGENYPELVRRDFSVDIGVIVKEIQIESQSQNLEVGDIVTLSARVVDNNGYEYTDDKVKWYSSNSQIAEVDLNTGVVTAHKKGNVTITAKLQSDESITKPIELTISEKETRTNEEIINDTINELRNYYQNKNEFTSRQAIGYKHSSNNLSEDILLIKSKYKVVETNEPTDYAKNIIVLLAVGDDPANYNGIDYVTGLISALNTEVQKQSPEPTQIAWSIFALDMTGVNYDTESALKKLIELQADDGSFGNILDYTAMCIMAFQNHKDVEGVIESLNKGISNILANKENIINSDSTNQYTISSVIQGLISVGENPLSDKWTTDDSNTMLNALLKYKEGNTFGNDMATEQAFIALADLYKKESMFTGAKINSDGYDRLFVPDETQEPTDPPEPPVEEGATVNISVKGYRGKSIVRNKEVEIQDGDTVLDILKKVLNEAGKDYKIRNGYVISIDGLAEKDKGVNSGWMYNIDGKTPDEGADSYSLRGGEDIEWFYTDDYTEDSRNTGDLGDEVEDEIDNANNVLDDNKASEKDIVEAVNGVSDQLDDKAKEMRTEKDARELVDDIEDVSRILEKAADRIESNEGAKDIAGQSLNMIELLTEASKKISKDEDKEEIGEIAADSIETTLKLMDKIEEQKEVNKIANDIIKYAGELKKNIGKENSKGLEEKAVSAAQKAIEKSGMLTITKNKLKTEGDKSIAAVSSKEIDAIIKNVTNTAKDMKEKLSENDIKTDKQLETKLAIEIPDAGKEAVETNLPASFMESVKENDIDKVEIKTEVAAFNITPKTFGDKAQGKEISLNAKEVKRSEIPESARNSVPENSPIVDLDAKIGQEKISSFEEPMIISIPYKAEVKKGEKVEVFFLRDDGTIEPMEGEYDPITNMVIFKTSHFSKYFVKKIAEKQIKGFTDLAGYDWAKEAIEVMANKSIISGRKEGIFDPGSSITRAEFATLITKMMGYENSNDAVPFTDVEKTNWYYDAIAKAYKNGLISGRSKDIFDPQGKITRQEMAVIIAKVLEKKGHEKAQIKELDIFKDKEGIAPWAKDKVALSVSKGIISGMGDKIFAPTQNATRAQAAVMLYRLYNIIIQ